MIVGALRVTLRLPENASLKGKRQVVKSLLERVRQRFNVAAAEIDDQEAWQLASLGFTCVSNSDRHAKAVLSSVLRYIEASRLDAEIVDSALETDHVL